jgi:hypothetical protein
MFMRPLVNVIPEHNDTGSHYQPGEQCHASRAAPHSDRGYVVRDFIQLPYPGLTSHSYYCGSGAVFPCRVA